MAILITGAPGSGKTTLIRRLLAGLDRPAGGFYTQEIRHQGARLGFELITLDGRQGILAHVDIRGRYRVGRYGVDLNVLDDIGVGAIRAAVAARAVVVIDEIGPMEIASERFRQAVIEALDSHATVLATIVKRSIPFADQIKARPDVRLFEVRPDNREELVSCIAPLLKAGEA
jgi:nucleoside-triphosphatase